MSAHSTGVRRNVFLVAFALALPAASALAGGYDTGERDWDFLFQESNIAWEAGTRYFDPQRRITNVNGRLGPAGDTDETESFTVDRFSVAVNAGNLLRCMGSSREPWGGHANYGNWGYSASAVEQHFTSLDRGFTCAVSMPLDRGRLSLVGGYSVQNISYELSQRYGIVAPPSPRDPSAAPFVSITANTEVSGKSDGWRVGLAYEIPEYALRASLIYNSQMDFGMEGTVNNLAIPYSGPVFGEISMPQSAEFKFQSGVAPGWLAFGSVKWTDWSVVQNMPLCPVGTPTCNQANAVSALTLLWKDTWTITGGAAYQFFDGFSVAGHVTWDQGATQGFTSQTDTWVGGLTAVFSPSQHVELKFGGTAGIMTGGELSTMTLPGGAPNPVGYTAEFGDDYVYSLNASIAFRF
ncbi:MAG: outer membrane protein transport protein [Pseudomonadota bacterium]|nr:outer membrane protein transport protein [Pseudomonadota bacterium]